MSCGFISKPTIDLCQTNLGGIVELYLIDAETVTAITPGTASTLSDEGIVGISLSGDSKFEKFNMRKQTSSFESSLVTSDNGAAYVSTVLSYVMPRMDASKRAAMQAFILSECIAIVKTANGNYFLIGDMDNPLRNTNATGSSGVAKGDQNAYTVELTAETAEWPNEIDPDIIPNIVA